MSKQVLILVDELELLDIQMGLNKIYSHWADTLNTAVGQNCSDDYIGTVNMILENISKLETKLNIIQKEQFSAK